MISKDAEAIVKAIHNMENRLIIVEQMLFKRLKIAKIMNVSDDKVHMAMSVVQTWETPDGVVIQVK